MSLVCCYNLCNTTITALCLVYICCTATVNEWFARRPEALTNTNGKRGENVRADSSDYSRNLNGDFTSRRHDQYLQCITYGLASCHYTCHVRPLTGAHTAPEASRARASPSPATLLRTRTSFLYRTWPRWGGVWVAKSHWKVVFRMVGTEPCDRA